MRLTGVYVPVSLCICLVSASMSFKFFCDSSLQVCLFLPAGFLLYIGKVDAKIDLVETDWCAYLCVVVSATLFLCYFSVSLCVCVSVCVCVAF